MKAYYLRPGHLAKTIDVQDEPQALSELVGGFLEQLGLDWHPIKGGLCVLVNEDGHSLGLMPNFRSHLAPYDGPPQSVHVVGPAVLVRYNASGDLVDITGNDVALFHEAPER